jgi:putative oxidoreductase
MLGLRQLWDRWGKAAVFITPIGDLAARAWVAWSFFKAGLLKMTVWQSTLMLFTHEYQVPLLPPVTAAYIGTGLELVLPILLVLGLGGRFFTLIFFAFNVAAVVSYPFLLTPAGGHALSQHICWALLLLMLLLHGTGKLSIDYWIKSSRQKGKLFH